jgi:hypothetical protein
LNVPTLLIRVAQICLGCCFFHPLNDRIVWELQFGSEETESQPHSEISDSSTALSGDELPYIFDRNGVKDDRKMIQYFLRSETETLETEVKHAVEQDDVQR